MNEQILIWNRFLRRESDRGSVLTLGIGISILVLMLGTMTINVMTLWSTRTALNKIADAAALNAAQAVSTDDIYRTGQVTRLFLNPQAARVRVSQYINRPEVKVMVHNLGVVKVQVRGATVTVEVKCTPHLPFGYLLPSSISSVRAIATAENLTQ